ncbi:MAG: phospho-sugar mutase [Candidatus Atribacteria bacterium]|nr:phospho-sugar mutase [Candidatus Atribacteria bacterium]
MSYLEKYYFWLENEYFDEPAKAELRALSGNKEEIKDRFYKDLEFGTGGLRGKIAMGTNRMNIYTVSRTTQGLANYLLEESPKNPHSLYPQNYLDRGVVIAYDCRHKSREFAETVALVLNANHIKTFLFEDIRPTPELSFAVRYLHAIAGIVITASHNPPEYNGYKIYSSDGGQIIPEIADKIIYHINQIKDYSLIKKIELSTATKKGLFNIIGSEIDQVYLQKVKELTIRDGNYLDKAIKIVYTSLHGVGNIPIRMILKERGFTNVFVVEEQTHPDPNFSTVESPNPENPAVFELAIQLGQKVNAEILIATDPDSDRIGLAVKNDPRHCEEHPFLSLRGSETTEAITYTVLNGNQVGVLLLHYILSSKKELYQLPTNGFIVKTVVTSDMSRVIADSFGVETYETLTGFKFICHQVKIVEEKEKKSFLFGYEESIGYLAGDFVRDKDAVIASMLICEMAAYYHKKGLNLLQALEDLYNKYGYYEEDQHSIYLEGQEGEKKMVEIMEIFRKDLPQIKNMEIIRIDDILIGKSYHPKSPTLKTTSLDLPPSNVLKIIFSDDSWYCLRPSGTEPKIKLYLSFHAQTKKEALQKLHHVKTTLLQKINNIINAD